MIFLLRITPSVRQRREVLEILHRVEGPTSVDLDCLHCAIYERASDEQDLLYMEHWKSTMAAHRHIQSPMFAMILAAMDLSTIQPEINFYEISQSWGMELIQALRTQKEPIESYE